MLNCLSPQARPPRHDRRRRVRRTALFAPLLLLFGACADITTPGDHVKQPLLETPLNVSAGDGPKISTDLQDYSLGSTVEISGWGWTPGETVRLQVVHLNPEGDNSRPEHQPWDVVADANGEVVATWLIAVDGDEGGATLKLTADGQTSAAHAEVVFTDLIGTVYLYTGAYEGTSQSAFAWGTTIYPQIRGAQVGTCYRLTWKDPSNATVGTPATVVASASNTNAPVFVVPAVGPSGTWSLVVDQNTSGNCAASFTSPTNPILIDVARAVVIGAGTTGSDATGGDQCVYLGSAPPGSGCASGTATTTWVRSSSAGDARTFVRFDLGAASPSVPAGALVTSAQVRLTVAGTAGSARTYNIQRAAATWGEGVLWSTQPGVTGTIGSAAMATTLVAGAGGGDPQTWVRWTVSTDVQGFVDGSLTNHGWRVSDASEGSATSVTGRFNATETTTGCPGVGTCRRAVPVLLIDYSDPPKLAFISTPFTGQVGACLGPMRVQSRDFGGSPLPVGSNTTVNLATANLGVGAVSGTPGAGAFYSDNTCATGTTTTTISSGTTNSADFYYRATERGDGTHDVVASATGYTPNASQTQTINKAVTTLTYTGDRLVFVGNTFNFSAVMSSAYEPCTENKRILFRILPSPLDNNVAFYDAPAPHPFTNTNGVATKQVATTGWLEGIYDARAAFNGPDDNCVESKDDYTVSVLTPGGAATGGGFLAGNKVGGGRANFGFTIRPIDGSNPLAYKGQFLLIRQDGGVPTFRCKGAIDTYGVVQDQNLNVASGRCDFQVWNASLNGGDGGWEVPVGPGYTNRQFIIQFIDNGTGKGKDAPPPDKFGFSIDFVGTAPDPGFGIADINGGNIDVKGTSTTPGGTTTKPGKKG